MHADAGDVSVVDSRSPLLFWEEHFRVASMPFGGVTYGLTFAAKRALPRHARPLFVLPKGADLAVV